MKRSLREYSVTIALLVATLCAVFFPVIFNGRTMLPSDLIDTMTLPFSQYFGPQHAYNSLITDGCLQFYPLKYLTQQAYQHGVFAFWNPYILNGYPQYAEGMWTYNFVLFLPFAIAFRLIVLLPLLVAGVGFYALMCEYNVRVGIARIFATAYMLNALFITNLLAHFIPASFSFAPLAILFIHKYDRIQKFKYLALSSIALAFGFLAGNVQTCGFLVFTIVGYWFSLWLIRSPRSHEAFLRPLCIVLGLAVGLSAIMLLPMLELFHETIRGGAFFSTSLLRSYDIIQRIGSLFASLTFFIPQLAGSIRGVTVHQVIGVYAQDFEGAIGFLPLLMAVCASFVLWKRMPEIRPFVILMIAGLVLPVVTPLFRFLYHRFFIVFIFGACGSGAIGMEAILSSNEWNASIRKWVKAFAVLLCGVVLSIIAFIILRESFAASFDAFTHNVLLPRLRATVFAEGNSEWVSHRFEEAINYWRFSNPALIVGIVSSFLGMAILWWKDRFNANAIQVCVWFITAIQLFAFVRSWVPMLDSSAYPLYPETRETRMLEVSTLDSRAYFYREIDTAHQFAFMNNENVVYGIPEATGYASMTPRSLYIYTAILHWRDSGLVSPKFLGKFNIGTLARVKPLPFDSLTPISSGPIWIYKNPWVLPRVYLARRTEIVSDDSVVLRRMLSDTAPWPVAYFTPEQEARAINTRTLQGDTVVIIQNSENEVVMSAICTDSSYLILTDTYYHGWEASVDGNDVRILRSNFAMRAIELAPGKHRVKFVFRPRSFRIGAWISLLSLVTLVGLWLTKRKA